MTLPVTIIAEERGRLMGKTERIKGLMTIPEVMEYLQIGERLAYRFVKEIGAERKIGRNIYASKNAIDSYFATGEKQDEQG